MMGDRFHLPRRLLGAVIGDRRYGDVGPITATVRPHGYLLCHDCGSRVYVGLTNQKQPLFVCRSCRTITDTRRVP